MDLALLLPGVGVVDGAATEQVEHVQSHGRGVYVAGSDARE